MSGPSGDVAQPSPKPGPVRRGHLEVGVIGDSAGQVEALP
jgi:hypothetical protein